MPHELERDHQPMRVEDDERAGVRKNAMTSLSVRLENIIPTATAAHAKKTQPRYPDHTGPQSRAPRCQGHTNIASG